MNIDIKITIEEPALDHPGTPEAEAADRKEHTPFLVGWQDTPTTPTASERELADKEALDSRQYVHDLGSSLAAYVRDHGPFQVALPTFNPQSPKRVDPSTEAAQARKIAHLEKKIANQAGQLKEQTEALRRHKDRIRQQHQGLTEKNQTIRDLTTARDAIAQQMIKAENEANNLADENWELTRRAEELVAELTRRVDELVAELAESELHAARLEKHNLALQSANTALRTRTLKTRRVKAGEY